MLDVVVGWAAGTRTLGLSTKPLAIDSSMFEVRHTSRHYERRRKSARKSGKGYKSSRSVTVRRLPKLALATATACHLIVSMWTGTGTGSDSPHFGPVLRAAKARVPHKHLASVQDAGYDGEHNHVLAREEVGVRSITPPTAGRRPSR